MSSAGSVTGWLRRLQAGQLDSVQQLWERYFTRTAHLARALLQGAPRRVSDEEDVALSAFDSFCRGAAHGRFPQLLDRDNLWAVLVVITTRKALDQKQHERRFKRGGGRSAAPAGLVEALSREPGPESVALMADECRRLLECLGDPRLQTIAVRKMEGYGNEELAEALGCSLSTVERKLRLIRTLWSETE
jgi:DNA-directed RNA polymerase specialized sigma24 family protein